MQVRHFKVYWSTAMSAGFFLGQFRKILLAVTYSTAVDCCVLVLYLLMFVMFSVYQNLSALLADPDVHWTLGSFSSYNNNTSTVHTLPPGCVAATTSAVALCHIYIRRVADTS